MENQYCCFPHLDTNLKISGSRAEGFDMKDSDLDIMSIEDIAHEIHKNLHINNGFLYDSTPYDNTISPGYTYVKGVYDNENTLISSVDFRQTKLVELEQLFYDNIKITKHL